MLGTNLALKRNSANAPQIRNIPRFVGAKNLARDFYDFYVSGSVSAVPNSAVSVHAVPDSAVPTAAVP